MIESPFMPLSSKPANADGLALSPVTDTEIDSQVFDLQENSFGKAMLSQFDELSESDFMQVAEELLVEQELLPEGNDLPFSALPGAEITSQSVLQIGSELEVLSENEIDDARLDVAIIHAPVVELVNVRERKPGTTATSTLRDPQQIMTALEKAQTEVTSILKSNESIMRSDMASSRFELVSGTMQVSERGNEQASLVNTSSPTRISPLDMSVPAINAAKISIAVPVQQAKWADNLAGRVTWMTLNNQTSAQINLNPAELGPIEVKVSFHQDQASVNFYAHNATVRDAIEEAFPRLREMLSENGLNLGQSSVSDQSLSEKQGHNEAVLREPAHFNFHDDSEASAVDSNSIIRVQLGLVDHFV